MGGGGFGGDIDKEWPVMEKEEETRLCANGEGLGCFIPDMDERPCSNDDKRLGCLAPDQDLYDEMTKNKKGDGESSDDDDNVMEFLNDIVSDGAAEKFSFGIAAVATVAITQLF